MFQSTTYEYKLQKSYLQNRLPFFIREPFHCCFPKVFLDIIIIFFLGFLYFLISLTYIFRCDAIILIRIFQKKINILNIILYLCTYQLMIGRKRNVTDFFEQNMSNWQNLMFFFFFSHWGLVDSMSFKTIWIVIVAACISLLKFPAPVPGWWLSPCFTSKSWLFFISFRCFSFYLYRSWISWGLFYKFLLYKRR